MCISKIFIDIKIVQKAETFKKVSILTILLSKIFFVNKYIKKNLKILILEIISKVKFFIVGSLLTKTSLIEETVIIKKKKKKNPSEKSILIFKLFFFKKYKAIARYIMQKIFEILIGNKKIIGINKNVIFIIPKSPFLNMLSFTRKF